MMEVKTHNFFETSLNPKLTGDSGSNFRPGEYKIVFDFFSPGGMTMY